MNTIPAVDLFGYSLLHLDALSVDPVINGFDRSIDIFMPIVVDGGTASRW